MMSRMRFGSYTIEISHEEKILFEEANLSKVEFCRYYRDIAETILPYLEGRPVSMERHPDGIDGEGFYQKEVPDYFPDWIDKVRVSLKGGGRQYQVTCDKAATLVYLANQGCITPHVWLSREGALDRPDRLVIDLDPAGGDFGPVRVAARRVRDLLEEIGLAAFVMLTGSRGVHVVVPLDGREGFDAVRGFAQRLVEILARRHPDDLTVEARKEKRGDRIYLDVARNAYGQTAVPPYAVRARKGATVAVPIDWDELSSKHSADYTIRNVRRRLGQKGDPWKGMGRRAASLHGPREKIDALA
jgi:bifunctional non-homologous end joining protein LigD